MSSGPVLAAALVLLAARPARADYALTASSAPAQLTLPGCVAQALGDAVTVLKSANLDRAAAAELLQGYAQFLPNLEALGTYGQQHGSTNFAQSAPTIVYQNSRGYAYQLSSTLNLFSGFSDYGAFRAALGTRKAAGLDLERARQQVALDVEQAYLQVKLDEEIAELRAELPAADPVRLADEVGDLLFVVVNLARKLDLDPEACLRGANQKFLRRFNSVEASLAAEGRTPAEASLADMDLAWQAAKKRERA